MHTFKRCVLQVRWGWSSRTCSPVARPARRWATRSSVTCSSCVAPCYTAARTRSKSLCSRSTSARSSRFWVWHFAPKFIYLLYLLYIYFIKLIYYIYTLYILYIWIFIVLSYTRIEYVHVRLEPTWNIIFNSFKYGLLWERLLRKFLFYMCCVLVFTINCLLYNVVIHSYFIRKAVMTHYVLG